MANCKDCEQTQKRCICKAVDDFFDANRELMDDLADQEEIDKLGRCLACYFSPCRCTPQ